MRQPRACAVAVRFYNEERPHMSIDMMTPREAASCVGEITKRWKSYREIHIKENMNSCIIPEKGVRLCSRVQGFLLGYALQSTLDSNKDDSVNLHQL